MTHFNVNEHIIIKTQLFLSRVVDGDGIILNNLFNKSEEEIMSELGYPRIYNAGNKKWIYKL